MPQQLYYCCFKFCGCQERLFISEPVKDEGNIAPGRGATRQRAQKLPHTCTANFVYVYVCILIPIEEPVICSTMVIMYSSVISIRWRYMKKMGSGYMHFLTWAVEINDFASFTAGCFVCKTSSVGGRNDVAAPGNKMNILNGRVRFTVVEKKFKLLNQMEGK
jgi:hypothetical protein